MNTTPTSWRGNVAIREIMTANLPIEPGSLAWSRNCHLSFNRVEAAQDGTEEEMREQD